MTATAVASARNSGRARLDLNAVTQYPATVLGAAMLLPKIGLRGFRYVLRRPLILRDLKTRFQVPVLDNTAELEQAAEVETEVAKRAAVEDWHGLADYLRGLDESRIATASGRRHVDIALYFLRGCLCEHFEYPNDRCNEFTFNFSTGLMRRLADAQKSAPDDHILAAILARFHLDCGWIARSGDWLETGPDEAPAVMNAHFAAARDLVTRFDPVAYDSPLLAEIQYRLCIGVEDGHERLEAAFADWSDLDPTNPATYRLHGFYCLPRWFGDFKILETEAAQAADNTAEHWGDAAYTLMMLQALRYDTGAALYLKPERFLTGLDDLFAKHRSDPFQVTEMLDALRDALREEMRVLSGPDRALKRVSDAIRLGLGEVLRAHLSAFCPAAWNKSEDEFLEWTACAYLRELENGATVELQEHGAKIYGALPA